MADEGKTYICEKCGGVVHIGDFPFCKGAPGGHGQWTGAEEPCEPFFDDNISTDGEEFTSMRNRVRYMDKHGLEPTKFRSDPGSKIARGSTGKLLFVDMGKK